MPSSIVYERFLWFELQAKGGRYPNSTTLARQFEISQKTAQRAIVFMRDRLGCPLVFDQHRKGYYYSNNTFSLSAIRLSAGDLSSLLLARDLLNNVTNRTLGKDITHAIDKIAVALKSHGVNIRTVKHAVSLRFIEYTQASETVFKHALEACLNKRSIEITYASPASNEPTHRTVDPYHLYNYMGTWHLVGYCHLRRQFRNFNLLRIADIRMLKQTFIIRGPFDADHYFSSSFGIFKGYTTRTVTLRFSPLKAKWVDGLIWHPKQGQTICKDGSLELTFPVAEFAEIVMEILKHGAGVEVVSPPELRDLVKNEAEKVSKLYKPQNIEKRCRTLFGRVRGVE